MGPTKAIINLNNFNENIKILKSLQSDGFFCPMVKADAYGHGAIELTKAMKLQGVTTIGVAKVSEGVELRQHFPDLNILVFSYLSEDNLSAYEDFNLTPVIGRHKDFEILKHQSLNLKRGVHLILNTGMNRLDLDFDFLGLALKFFADHPKTQLSGLLTHLSTAEDIGTQNSSSLKQLKKFNEVLPEFTKYTNCFHAFNSMGLIAKKYMATQDEYKAFTKFGSRPGISIYGAIKPEGNLDVVKEVNLLNLKPVMQLETEIIHVHSINAGEAVSYGGRWVAKRPSKIAVLPIGYADGLARSLSSNLDVIIDGSVAPVVGTVCMDFCMIDITDVNHAKEGSKVVIFGGATGNSAISVADRLGTISYEVLTSIGKRVPRVYKY